MAYGTNNLLTKDEVIAKVACPTCGVPRGEACRHDPPKDSNHMDRVKAARREARSTTNGSPA